MSSEPEIDNSMETFMTLFNKMFSETKYNLQALNKRMESMDKTFSNILLLTSNKPFDEENQENINDENIKEDNLPKKKKSNSTTKNNKNKMTEQELDEIEKMFRNIEDDTPIYSTQNIKKDAKEQNNSFLNKKRKKKNEKEKESNLIKDPKNFYNDIKELLKNYSLDNEDDKDKNKIELQKENKEPNEKTKRKRGRKKKVKGTEEESESESNEDVDYLVPEKNDGYSKFKEFKELQKKVGNKIYNKSSDEEDDDELDSDI